jgi:predicted transcriptional regulator
MAADSAADAAKGRHSIFELAPLELHCMNALWSLGEGSVRDIREALAPSLPRAYTTIMTIMDRLAQKGVVARQKIGRAYLYRPNLSAEVARSHAVEQVVEHFFGGSAPALQDHLASPNVTTVGDADLQIRPPAASLPQRPRRSKSEPETESQPSRPAPSIDEVLL